MPCVEYICQIFGWCSIWQTGWLVGAKPLPKSSLGAQLQSTLDTSIPDIRIYWLQAYLHRSHIVNKHILDTRIFLFFWLSHHTYACS